ncbi:uncharacterized protein si:ch211-276i12.4 isoform X2 [Tachysurus fulvidraco]|uniref:uncharacterized protein si:ch211-276i12.4 isoform X2 n=1 Tax=Tachysurus fulvidraco TaxID=1234273 RepID=UPI001FEF8A8D|nr:uncharacterized protein si:ch211-276i12.4 isoform X2 [Tachysurus fulvidraco]
MSGSTVCSSTFKSLSVIIPSGGKLLAVCTSSKDLSHHHLNQHNSRCSSGNSNVFHQYGSQNQPDHHQNVEGTACHKGVLTEGTISSSSSSSTASLFSESSLDSEWHFLLNKPQHSVSCSNLPEARIFQDEASGNIDFDLCDLALNIHHKQQKQQHFGHSGLQQQVSERRLRKSPLFRCQSKIEDGLLQSVNQEHSTKAYGRPHPLDLNHLYKTTSLGQNLAVKDKAAATVNMARPKRAVSSIQLPSKGILKNKDEGQKHGNVRKAKSMEALSTKRQSTNPHMQSSVDTLRDNFVRGKTEFSAFLDEITRQVISPSRLSSFRSRSSHTPTSHLPQEDCTQPAKTNQEREDLQKTFKQHNVHSVQSNNEKGRIGYNKHGQKQQTGSSLGLPHQHQCQKHQGKYSQLLSEGTSTSSESILQEKQYQAKGKWGYNDGYGICRELNIKQNVSSLPAALGMQFTKKSPTMTSPNLENISKRKYMGYRRHTKQLHRDSVSSMNRVDLPEHYNKDLHENLLQMVSCIQNMEAELQCTKTELSRIKEKCKKLQDSYISCQQANSVLEKKLHSVVDSMNSEQKDYFYRISELTKQPDTAKNTVVSLESINIPSLIKELSDKHFDSEDIVNSFLLLSHSQLDTDKSDKTIGLRDNQSSTRKRDDRVSDWLPPGQGDSADRQEHVAAFLPWAESQDPWVGLEKTDASDLLLPKSGHSSVHSIAEDMNSAIYRNIPDAKANIPRGPMQSLGLEAEINSVSMLAHSSV